MLNNKHKHFVHYIPLFGILFFGVLGFILYPYDKAFLASLSIAMCLSYVSWGLIHHIIHKDICLSIVMEYLTVAILGTVIIASLVFRM